MYFNLLIALHWPLFKDECVLSYVYKKIKNPKYTAGSDPTVLDDWEDLKKKTNNNFNLAYVLIPILAFTFYSILRDTPGFPMTLGFLFIVTWLSYLVLLRKLHTWESEIKKQVIIGVRCAHFIIVLITAIYYTKVLFNQKQ
ncbi:MAG: hypothetical protein VKK05_03080 [Synechococcus sp.]|nr:hypothetical protein [Synechococcus sp.]